MYSSLSVCFEKRIVALLGIFFLFAGGLSGQQKTAPDSFDFYTSDSVRIPVQIIGKGPYCLFVPGGPGGGYRSFSEVGGSNVGSCLRMVFMDQRGSGSAGIAKDYSLDRLLRDMEELRKHLGITSWFIMSHSFGGVIAVNYAYHYPAATKGLILVNSTLHFLNPVSTQAQLRYGYSLLGIDTAFKSVDTKYLFEQMGILHQKLSALKMGYRLLTDSISTIRKMDQLDEKYPRTNDFAYAVFGKLANPNAARDYAEYYNDYTILSPKIKAKTLVITGDKDYAVGTQHYKLFHFPHQTTVVINGGHLLYAEHNRLFVDAVCHFIRTCY